MCGITGYADFSSKNINHNLNKMTDSILYRGPDSSGHFYDRNKKIGLGIRRLSIIDLSTGDQPIRNEDGSIVIVFNGEIYNFKSLKRDLIKDGHKFKTKSDTEVLVHLYEKYGTKMCKHLNGMFVFAIWDKNKARLFMGRDQAGVKPLYYYNAGKTLVFGSEPKTILKHPLYKNEIDRKALADYFYLGYFTGEKSIYSGIKKLLPGHSLSFSKSGLKIYQYYEPKIVGNPEGSLEDLFTESVEMQMFADVPVGIFLSGGLDSSLVAYYLSKSRKNLKTFSISFEDKSFDEAPFAEVVAKKIGSKHTTDTFGSKDVIDSFEKITGLLDEPFADPSLFPTFKLAKITRKHVKVALSGDGGDELFGGYPTYFGHLVAQKLQFIPGFSVDIALGILGKFPVSHKNYALKDVASNSFSGLKLTPIERHLLWMSVTNNKKIYKKPNFKWIKSIMKRYEKVELSRSMQLLDYHTYLPDDLLFKVDRAAMYNSLEVRVPFLDPRIIDLAYSTNKKHVGYFKTKIMLRKMLENDLPEIAKRNKKGFGIPVAKWINSDLKDLIYTYVANKKIDDYLDRKLVDQIYRNHIKNKQNNAKVIWAIVMFSAWLDNWYTPN